MNCTGRKAMVREPATSAGPGPDLDPARRRFRLVPP